MSAMQILTVYSKRNLVSTEVQLIAKHFLSSSQKLPKAKISIKDFTCYFGGSVIVRDDLVILSPKKSNSYHCRETLSNILGRIDDIENFKPTIFIKSKGNFNRTGPKEHKSISAFAQEFLSATKCGHAKIAMFDGKGLVFSLCECHRKNVYTSASILIGLFTETAHLVNKGFNESFISYCRKHFDGTTSYEQIKNPWNDIRHFAWLVVYLLDDNQFLAGMLPESRDWTYGFYGPGSFMSRFDFKKNARFINSGFYKLMGVDDPDFKSNLKGLKL